MIKFTTAAGIGATGIAKWDGNGWNALDSGMGPTNVYPRGVYALAIFLFPFALVLRELGVWALGAMGAFLGILALGWVYAYREGILDWK